MQIVVILDAMVLRLLSLFGYLNPLLDALLHRNSKKGYHIVISDKQRVPCGLLVIAVGV